MKITLSHPDCPDTYQIRPYSGGTCLELIKNPDNVYTGVRNGKTYTQPRDQHPKYPWDIGQGLKLAVQAMYMNPKCTDNPVEVDISSECEKISQYFKEWLDKVQIDIEQ